MRKWLSLLLLIMFAVGCSKANQELPAHNDFNIDMTQEEIQQQFGDPIHKAVFHKNGNHIWGELENIWHSLPNGSTIDVWIYPSTSNSGNGKTELYFLDGATTAFSIGFSPEGVVYESNGT